MRRIGLAAVLALGLLAAPLTTESQQAGKGYRIGLLREGQGPPGSSPSEAALRELGWIECQKFKIERRNADRREQLPAVAAELVKLKVDLILTGGTPAAQAAKAATKTIPIVFNLG